MYMSLFSLIYMNMLLTWVKSLLAEVWVNALLFAERRLHESGGEVVGEVEEGVRTSSARRHVLR